MEDVLQCLIPPPHHLVELEVVTVKHLVSKISDSFAAASLYECDDQKPAPSLQRNPDPCISNLLPEAPVFLLGVLSPSVLAPAGSSSNAYPGLILADATGNIACEVG